METKGTVKLMAAVAFGLLLSAPFARAQGPEVRQLTKITFDQPLQISGFVLEAGTYWFQLAAPEHNATVVQVLNENREQLIERVLVSGNRSWATETPILRIVLDGGLDRNAIGVRLVRQVINS